MDWTHFAEAVSGVGALGVAAFGLVESLGKAFAYGGYGLPYAGFGVVKKAIAPLETALKVAYGADYMDVISQQYRADRGSGKASDTIRQGVRLGLPFMVPTEATKLITAVWDMPAGSADALAAALQAPPVVAAAPASASAYATPAAAAAAIPVSTGQALAGRFATALDARIQAAFDMAEERYEAYAKGLAAVAAIGLALLFNWGLGFPFSTPLALVIGAVAVPLAPVAKDVSTSLQNALTAFKSVAGKS